MATPFRIKRSALSNKRPTISDLQLGELALNTYDGYLFAERDTGGVGIGTTVALLTPWVENFGAQSIYYNNSVGIGTTNATSKLTVTGDALVSGVITATTFSGTSTYAISAGIATALQYPRTFEITGDIVASAISFDGTGNVSLAATIQPNSVGLGTDTTGDYVKSISGTSNQITVTSGTGEGSTPILSLPSNLVIPQDITVTQDLQVNRNLNVTGNITIGGTTAAIFAQELNIFDPDIVLGFRTDAFGNDISNDTTSNHGGVALASTEGTPLVDLFIAGIETNLSTYKKIMWFRAGTFAGLGTDAWLINYGVGIGSTQFPLGTRLAAGNVQFTQSDLAVVRNINASGISTLPTLNSTTGTITAVSGTNLNYTGIGTITTLNSTTGNIDIGIVTTISGTNLNYTGIGTIATLNSTNAIFTNVNSSGITTSNAYYVGATQVISSGRQLQNIASLDAITTATIESAISNAPNTFTDLQVTGISTFVNGPVLIGSGTSTGTASQPLQVTGGSYISGNTGIGTINPTSKLWVSGDGYFTGVITATTFNGQINSGIGTITTLNSTTGTITAVSGTNLNYTGIGTIATLNSTTGNIVSGIVTTISGTNLNYTGIGTIATLNSTTGTITAVSGTNLNYTGIGTITTLNSTTGTITAVSGTNLNYSGVGTITTLNSTNAIFTNVNSSGITTSNAYYVGATQVISSGRQLQNIASLDATTTATIESAISNAPNIFSDLQVTGISTFVNGPVLIGTATSTGTVDQDLQVTGGAYVSSNLGIGTTNPASKFTVIGQTSLFGDLSVSGITTTARLNVGTGGTVITTTVAGLVGIGTTNPQTKLEIDGVLGFTGSNVKIGDSNTGSSITSGSNNNFLGNFAGQSNTIGGNNNFFGYRAGVANTTGGDNNFFGYLAGTGNKSGTGNNFFGYLAGTGNTTGDYNTYIGGYAGSDNETGSQNIVIGYNQQAPILNGSNQLVIGAGSTSWITGNSSYNVGIGTTNPQTKVEINGVLGFTGSNVKIGNVSTGSSITTGINNFFAGEFAGQFTTDGTDNNFLGSQAGKNNTSGNSNNFLGYQAGVSNTTGAYNNFLGYTAGSLNTTGSDNIFIGQYVANTNTTGSKNNFFGLFAGGNNTTGNNNTFLGSFTGISTSASRKIILGSGSGFGDHFDSPDTTKDTQFAVGVKTDANPSKYWLVGDENFNIGIGTTRPTSKLHVSGNANITGIATASQFSTGASGTGINVDTNTISGPSILYIDPAGVGDNTGAVRIKGDLYVDGIQTIINSTTIDLADFRIGIGTTATSDIVLDGAGIGIGSAANQKTLTWNNSSTSLKSSENFDLASGKVYKINGTEVLSSSKLTIANIFTSGITTTGILNVGVGGTIITTTSGGRVGINSTNPNYTLDVKGDINTSTDVKINGISILTTASNDAIALAIALG